MENQNDLAIGTQTEYKIIGIEPGAGIMKLTNTANKRLWVG